MQARPHCRQAILPQSHLFHAELINLSFMHVCFLQQTSYELLPDLLFCSGGYEGLVK